MEPTNTPTTNPTPTPAPTPASEPTPAPAPVAQEPAPVAQEPVLASEPAPAPTPSLGAMDPIMMPTSPKAPDPVEEELKAPFKAAEPVPGSIGSAISVPSANGVKPNAQTPSVAFNDPAMHNQMAINKPVAKKKISNTIWILLGVTAVLIIGVLGFILYKLLNPGK